MFPNCIFHENAERSRNLCLLAMDKEEKTCLFKNCHLTDIIFKIYNDHVCTGIYTDNQNAGLAGCKYQVLCVILLKLYGIIYVNMIT